MKLSIAEQSYLTGSVAYTQGNMEAAFEAFEKTIRLYPKHSRAKALYELVVNDLVTKYYSTGEFTRALPYLQTLYRWYPDDKEIARKYSMVKSYKK